MPARQYDIREILIRAARELLRWDQQRLAAGMQMDVRTVRRMEEGEKVAEETWQRAFSTLESAGVRFTTARDTPKGRLLGGVSLYERNLMGPRRVYKPRDARRTE